MKHLRIRRKPSPAMIVAILALSVSLVGTAVAGPIAEISLNKGEKKQIRKISRNISNRVSNRRITQRAPGLSVANAGLANIANVANAANTANNAKNAENAENAAQLGGKGPEEYLASETQGVPIAGASVDDDGTVRRWFNRAGGEPDVDKTAPGRYRLDFPGLAGDFFFNESIAQVSLVQQGGEINRISFGGNPGVATYDSAGVDADREFEIVLFLPNSN